MNEETKNKIEPILEGLDLKIYDTEVATEAGSVIYRVYVTKSSGVTLDEIVEATKQISPILDVYPPVSGEYRLEVSSPGVERVLKKSTHFEQSIGEKARIKLKDKTKFTGTIKEVNGDDITLDVKGELEVYNINDMQKARTQFDW
ncbi:MAG: ribosome maturation factor RimP [Campylobacterales bacterium]|nr:ribosome maturation factor RimP [Campylobacterales bacterium]